MSGLRLITERIEEVNYLTEEKDGKKSLYIEGIFLQSGIKNKNGRMYPTDIMAEEVARYSKERIERGAAWGELGHPAGPTINPDRISHRITELRQDGKNWIGKATIINEGMGKIVRGLIESGGTLGVSSRALGSLKEQSDCMVVQKDFRLSTPADIVTDPSAPDAYVNGIMEGAAWIYDSAKDEWHQQRLDDARKQIKKYSRSQLEAVQLDLFENFLKTIKL